MKEPHYDEDCYLEERYGEKEMKTTEEKAKEYVKTKHTHIMSKTMKSIYSKIYLDGLAEGKPKWHDLRKNPNDLPKLADNRFSWSITVSNQNGEACIYNYKHSCWQTCLFTKIDNPIAWCELPKFEE